jgi:CRP/FNR family transcriptional regulator
MDNVVRLGSERARLPHAAWPLNDGRQGALELLRMMGLEADDCARAGAVPVAVRRVCGGEMLFHEGAAAEALHFVRAGTFKIFRTAEDGYEQVLGFAGRSEVMGFDAVCSGVHPSSAVALEDSSVFAVQMCDLSGLGQRMPKLDMLVLHAASSALASRGELADLMAAVAAEVRVARFLLQLSQRMERCAQSPRRFHLRMSRRDIASYLGLAHETVSRSFSALARWGLVRVNNRELEVLDMAGLHTLALNTRRQVDESAGAGRLHGQVAA